MLLAASCGSIANDDENDKHDLNESNEKRMRTWKIINIILNWQINDKYIVNEMFNVMK